MKTNAATGHTPPVSPQRSPPPSEVIRGQPVLVWNNMHGGVGGLARRAVIPQQNTAKCSFYAPNAY